MTEEPWHDFIRAAREEAAGAGVDPVARTGERAGDVIDRYKLLQELGEGGMGTVWMAEQTEPVRRRVALKVIKLGMDTREVIARFEAERQALALMDHPHIARVFDGGATEAGRPFFVMELVKGVPITDYCHKAKLGLRDRLTLFSQVCHALQHAHQKGIIHRDIKPNNVLVTMHDGVGVPKVIDFGIAKATSSELTQKTLFTQHARIIGTPEYMAPEQAEVSRLDIDTRADVYSLGVLLYELLTGTKPFDLESALESGYQEMLRTIREDEPVRPSTRVSTLDHTPATTPPRVHIDRLSHRLRGDLDWIVMKALEKDRTRRYETASSFADDIQRYLVDEPVAAGPPSRTYRLRKMMRRNRTAMVTGGLIAALMVGGTTAATLGWLHVRSVNTDLERAIGEKETMRAAADTSASRARIAARDAKEYAEQAIEERRQAEEEKQRAHKIADLLEQMLVSAGPLVAAGMDTELMRTILDDMGTQLFRGEVTDQQVAMGLHGTIGDTYRDMHMFDRSERHIRRALEIAEEEYPANDVRRIRGRTLLARLRVDQFREQEALDALRPLESWQENLGREHDAVLDAKLVKARALANGGMLAEARVILEELFEIRNRTLGRDHAKTVSAELSLAWTKLQQDPLESSEEALLQLIHTAQTNGRNSLSAMLAEKTLARLYYDRGRRGEAATLTAGLVERAERTYGPGYRLTVDLRLLYSTMLHEAGDVRQADRLLVETIEEASPHLGSASPGVRAARLTRGLQMMANGVRGQRGALDTAHAVLQENMDQDVDESEPNVSLTRQAMMMVCANQGDFDRVDELLARTRPAIRDFQRRFDDGDLRVDSPTFIMLKTLTNVGLLYSHSGRRDDGRELLEISLPIKRTLLGDEHPFTGIAARELARAYDALERDTDAAGAWKQYFECAVAQCAANPSIDAKGCNDLILQMLNHPRAAEILDLGVALDLADLGLQRSRGQDLTILRTRIDILVRMGRSERAIEELERVIPLAEDRPRDQRRLRAQLAELRGRQDR